MRGPSTFRNESRMRMYSITARRITSGEVLKYRDGLRWAMPEVVAGSLQSSRQVHIRVRSWVLGLGKHKGTRPATTSASYPDQRCDNALRRPRRAQALP